MKRALAIAATLFLCLAAQAQLPSVMGLDVDFDYVFDNNEFAASDDYPAASGTNHFVRVTPKLRFDFGYSERVSQTVFVGVNLRRDMGKHEGTFLTQPVECPIYYLLELDTKRNVHFRAAAGIYQRSLLKGSYSQAIFSVSEIPNDPNLEGMFFSWSSRRLYAEIALDWMGLAEQTSKERFQVVSAGKYAVLPWLNLGWSGSFYHYAGSAIAPGVVDNHLIQPSVEAEFAGYVPGFRHLSLKLSGLVGYQCDRVRDLLEIPYGFEALATAQYKSFGVLNLFVATTEMRPFFDLTDTGGRPYGKDLYRGVALYNGICDQADIFWNPRINDWMKLRLDLLFYFGRQKYYGCEQMLTLAINLSKLYEK